MNKIITIKKNSKYNPTVYIDSNDSIGSVDSIDSNISITSINKKQMHESIKYNKISLTAENQSSINNENNINYLNSKIKNISFLKKNIERNKCIHLDNKFFDKEKQLQMIKQLYISNHCEEYNLLKNELKRKINGYKHQDINKKLYDKNLIITLDEVIKKLVISELICVYCKCNIFLLYKNIRDENQWTLDRINNKLCHSNDNTLVSCLKCNLKRRNINMEKFKFTKQLNLIKK